MNRPLVSRGWLFAVLPIALASGTEWFRMTQHAAYSYEPGGNMDPYGSGTTPLIFGSSYANNNNLNVYAVYHIEQRTSRHYSAT